MDNTNVGVINHAHFGSLTLHSGHKYYATVTGIYLFIHSSMSDAICVFSKTLLNFFSGYDFVGRKASKTSESVIVDFTPPVITDEPIKLRTGRHIMSTTEVSVW